MDNLLDELGSALQSLLLLVTYETELPDCAKNGVTDESGSDEGVVRASEIIYKASEVVKRYERELRERASNERNQHDKR